MAIGTTNVAGPQEWADILSASAGTRGRGPTVTMSAGADPRPPAAGHETGRAGGVRAGVAAVVALVLTALPACQKHDEHAHEEHQKVVATSPKAETVVVTQPYVCQIHARRHIKIRALQTGFLEGITIKEGQSVRQDDLLFKVVPILYKARLDAEAAEVQLAQVKFDSTKRLVDQNVVSPIDLAMHQAELARAQAKQKLAEAELNFTTVKAPFDGIVDRLHEQEGSLVKENDVLTTLSDNAVMWVYFNVPEARYFEYKTHLGKSRGSSRVELVDTQILLVLADGSTFEHSSGNTVTIEGQFNNETGNIPFRADFPNPDGLLRHGQTGTVRIRRTVKDAVVIPQRATFEVLDKRYVFVIDKDHTVHRREIAVLHELDDVFVVKKDLAVTDRIVLEGVRQVNDGDKVEAEYRTPEVALANQKFHAE